MDKNKRFAVEVSPEEEIDFLEWVANGSLNVKVKEIYLRRLLQEYSKFDNKEAFLRYCNDQLLYLAGSQMRSSSATANLLSRLEMEVLVMVLKSPELLTNLQNRSP